jgi:hypothetical protein
MYDSLGRLQEFYDIIEAAGNVPQDQIEKVKE